MNDSEKLDFIVQCLTIVVSDVNTLKSDVSALKSDVNTLKSDVSTLKSDVSTLNLKFDELENQQKKTQLHLENETDKNIAILAENHINIIDRLNQAIPAADKNLIYEVKMNYMSHQISDLTKRTEALEAR